MSPELLSIIIGIIVFYAVFSTDKEKEDVEVSTIKRLHDIKNMTNSNESQDPKLLKHNIKVLIQDTEYKVKLLGAILNKIELTNHIRKRLKVADMKVTVDVFLIVSAGLSVPFLLLALLLPAQSAMFLILGLFLAYTPTMLVNMKIKKRLEMFTQQLPDSLGLISSSLRAGHSLVSSFQMVVQEMPDPISHIFKIVVDDISLGRDTRDSLDNMLQYMPGSVDLRFFITAVLIQREIGGNLAEILDNLNYTIRERFKLIGQLNAQTAQAKMSGIVLGLAPVFIGLLIWFMNPKYMEPLFKSLLGQLSLGAAFVFGILGFVTIKKITTIKM